MEFKELSSIIFEELSRRLSHHVGIYSFVRERSKFEGWLKVELCEILSKYFKNVSPEKDRIDIVFDDWALELKTINTSYKYENVKYKRRSMNKNIKNIIKDIEKMRSEDKYKKYSNKVILFIVFPVEHSKEWWRIHLEKISSQGLRDFAHVEIKFLNKIPGVIYLGLV